MARRPDAELAELAATVAVTRLVLGPRARIQAPPNLITEGHVGADGAAEEFALLLRAGIDDWGGVSPLTPDHVNPERPWPAIEELAERCADAGFELRERLTVYPQYALAGEPWLDPRIRPHVEALLDPETGLARPDAILSGRPWQDPEDLATDGRSELHTEIDTTGRASDRRADFDSVYGDWESVRTEAVRTGAPMHLDSDVAAALRAAERDPAGLSDEHALALLHADGPELDAVAALADQLRADVVGNDVTYVVNRNINFTNVCYTGCRFCAFAQRRNDADAYTLSVEEVGRRAEEAWALGATEVCMQGGIHPDLSGDAYFDIVRAVKRRVPEMHVHAFSPMEIVNGAARSNLSVRDWLTAAKEAGLDSIPGTAAEILDDDVRWLLTKGKLPASEWIDVVTTAHEVGLRSSSTMMYGHVDNPAHWLGHFRTLAGIQDRTGGFTEFVGAAVHPHQLADLPGRRGPPGSDPAREPGRARDGPDPAARADRQHPVLVGEAGRRGVSRGAGRWRQRPRRDVDGGDDQPDGGLAARVGQDGGPVARDRVRPAGAAGAAAGHHVRAGRPRAGDGRGRLRRHAPLARRLSPRSRAADDAEAVAIGRLSVRIATVSPRAGRTEPAPRRGTMRRCTARRRRRLAAGDHDRSSNRQLGACGSLPSRPRQRPNRGRRRGSGASSVNGPGSPMSTPRSAARCRTARAT